MDAGRGRISGPMNYLADWLVIFLKANEGVNLAERIVHGTSKGCLTGKI